MLSKLYKSQVSLIVVILCAGIFILFREVFTQGYVQVPGDILHADPVFSEETPEEFDRPSNSLLFDPLYQFYVWHSVAARVMKETGRIPLWNPYILAGQPLVANCQSSLFYPPNLLLFRFSPEIVATLRDFINIIVAGLFTFLFSRELGVSRNGAILAAIAFGFSGAVMVGPGLAYTGSLVWLPMILWAGEKILQDRREYFWGLICGFGIGLSILAGHPETVFHNGLVFVGYFGFRIFTLGETWRKRARMALPFFTAVGFGLLISAIQWLPFASLLANSGIKSRGVSATGGPLFFSASWLQNLSLLITLIFPNFFGNPVDFTYYWPFPTYQNFLEQSMYFGAIPFALAVGAMLAKRNRKSPVIPLAVLGLIFLFTALRFPIFEGLNHLPVFNAVNNTRLKWHFSFIGSILSGFGLDDLKVYFVEGRKENKKAVYGTLAIILFGLICLLVLLVNRYVIAPRYGIANFMLDINLLLEIEGKLPVRSLASIFALVVVTLGFYFVRWNAKNFRTLEWLVILATFFELIGIARGYNTTVPKDTLHPDIKLVKRLRQDESLYRIAGIPPTFWPNIGALFGLYHVGGSDLPIYKWNMDVYSAQDGGGYSQIWQPDWPLLDWMNVKYVISPERIYLPKYEAFIIRKKYAVYLNKDALPRAFMVYKVGVMNDRQEMLEKLVLGDFDFKTEVLLEQDMPEEQYRSIENPESSDSQGPRAAKFDVYENDKLEVRVETEKPGMLVMSEVYAPGWIAKIDGEKTQIYRANYAYRGVYVPAGKHRITMEYKPVEFLIGSWLTVIGVLLLVIGLPVLGLDIKSRLLQRNELSVHQGQEYLESM